MTETKLIYKAIANAMNDIDAIGKNSKNAQQNFMFRGIDDIYNCLHPIFSKHKLFTTTEVLEEKSEERQTKSGGTLIYRILKIKYTIYAEDGSSVFGIVIGEGMDSGDKASNKAMAIAHKYFLTQLFTIPTVEQSDPDSESHEVQFKNKKEPKTYVPNLSKMTDEQIQDKLNEHLVLLNGARNKAELQSLFKDAYLFADLSGNKKYMEQVVNTKDRMKKQFEDKDEKELEGVGKNE